MGVKIQSEMSVLKEPTHPSLLLLAPSSLDRLPAGRDSAAQELLLLRICRVRAGPGIVHVPEHPLRLRGIGEQEVLGCHIAG